MTALTSMTHPHLPALPTSGIKSALRQKSVITVIVFIVIIVLTTAVLHFTVADEPNPQVNGVTGQVDKESPDVYLVSATVLNNGGSGNITVYAELSGGATYERNSTNAYFQKGESRLITLSFNLTALALPQSNLSYKMWATPR